MKKTNSNKARQLGLADLEEIVDVESKAFIPSIQTTQDIIRTRLQKNHIYLGIQDNKRLVGTLAFRYAQFSPDFINFSQRYPNFNDYVENPNEKDANAAFIYSLGIVPGYRNAVNAKYLIQGAIDIAKESGIDYLVGDARIPSYNGSHKNPKYERFKFNPKLHKAVDTHLKGGALPSQELLEQDPVTGFYLKAFPKSKVLGITDENFWKGDNSCRGHMVIMYLPLGK